MINNIQTQVIGSKVMQQNSPYRVAAKQNSNNKNCFDYEGQSISEIKNFMDSASSRKLKDTEVKDKNNELMTFVKTVIGAAAVGAIGTLFYKNKQMARKLSNVTSELAKTTEQLNSTRASLDKANTAISNIKGIISSYANTTKKLNIGEITEKINSYNKLIEALKNLAKNVKP